MTDADINRHSASPAEGITPRILRAGEALRRQTARRETPRRRRRDPAPSRLRYRIERLLMRPGAVRTLKIGGPVLLLVLLAAIYFGEQGRRADLEAWFDAKIEDLRHREAFMVRDFEIMGASQTVARGLEAMLPASLPASSFDLDLSAIRRDALALDAIEKIDLRVRDGGVLVAQVTERKPALLWRHSSGIDMLDASGHRVASVTGRDVRPDLPLIAGAGAAEATAEALAILEASGHFQPRLRGLQRRGERRWDLVLDQQQRIMLPDRGALAALRRAIDLDKTYDLLGRDVIWLDMREPARPHARLGADARNALRIARGQPAFDAQGAEILSE